MKTLDELAAHATAMLRRTYGALTPAELWAMQKGIEAMRGAVALDREDDELAEMPG